MESVLSEFIIEKPLLNGRRLTSRVTTEKGLMKYLKNTELFIEYDEDVYLDDSILNIPLTAIILPIAWITGSDVRVGALDKSFKESMDELQKIFQQMYPKIDFITRINAEKIINNKIGEIDLNRRTGLLFSGGVDSTYSLITNLDTNPRLLMVWGLDDFPYPQRPHHWELVTSTYKKYAQEKDLQFNLIKTNISQITNNFRIEHDYAKGLKNKWFRSAISHSLVIIPLLAPISFGRFDRVLIAATYDSEFDFISNPQGTQALTDEKIVWADLKVKHDGAVTRPVKIAEISKYLQEEDLTLRVCVNSNDNVAKKYGFLNDNSCEKCYRTIVSLVLASIDPNICGFKVDKNTFTNMKTFLEKMNKPGYGVFWTDISKALPEKIDSQIEGAQEFFNWLKGFNPNMKDYLFFRNIYNQIPYGPAQILLKIYKVLGIKPRGLRI